MPLRIASPQVVAKVERLSRLTGLGKAAAVEAAPDPWRGIDALIERLHRLKPRSDAFEAVDYDELGLPG